MDMDTTDMAIIILEKYIIKHIAGLSIEPDILAMLLKIKPTLNHGQVGSNR